MIQITTKLTNLIINIKNKKYFIFRKNVNSYYVFIIMYEVGKTDQMMIILIFNAAIISLLLVVHCLNV